MNPDPPATMIFPAISKLYDGKLTTFPNVLKFPRNLWQVSGLLATPMKAALAASLLLAVVPSLVRGQAPANQSPMAPELVGKNWLNAPKEGSPTLAGRKGKVTLVAFWTFACINCQNNFAPYNRLLKTYRRRGVELISVHTPELPIERDPAEVEKHVKKFKIDYPVLLDPEGTNWKNWKQEVWPTIYVLDAKGRVRYYWVGELNYRNAGGENTVSKVIERLLSEQS